MDKPRESQAKRESYIEIKSPAVHPEVENFEGGALRQPRGSVSIFAWQNLGMAVHMAAIGTIYTTVSGVIYSVLNNYLHMSATLVATATALVNLSRSLRLFTGMLTDTVPIFGYRRRPYMVLGWSVTFVCCLLMAVLPLGEPYYSDRKIAKLDESKLTKAQLKTINFDAPDRGIKLIILLALANLGTDIAYSGFNGLMTDLSQREPVATRGKALGEGMVVRYLFSIFSAFFTGLGLNSAAYGGSFSWTVTFNGVMGICAAVSFITVPFSWYCITEERVESRPTRSVFRFLYELLHLRLIYRYVTFRFFYNVFSNITVTAASAIQSTWAKVEPLNDGIATMIAAVMTMTGTYCMKQYGLGWNWRTIIIVAQFLVVIVDVIPTMLTTWDVVRTQWIWLSGPLLEKLPYAASDYVGALFMLELESKDFEATMFGLAITSQRMAMPFATVLTKSIDGYLDIERPFIQKDDHHVRSQVTIAYLIAYAFNLFACVFVVFLPRQKDELHKLQREGRRSKTWGITALFVLIFTMLWTIMTNILSLSSSTKCLRIAGGNGCKKK